ncbi:MAG: AAA family ATPase [Proteobacteria bacterium]|nr:AAA family ATPase [Pseudomonadota bacterium]
MRIRKLTIENLFDIFNHQIPFKTKDHITIIHGPNGVGKTTILKLLSDLFCKRFSSLKYLPYKKLRIDFENPRSRLEVTRKQSKNIQEPIQLNFNMHRGKESYTYKTEKRNTIKEEIGRFPLSIIEELVDSLERVGSTRWLDRSSGDILDLDDVLSIYGHRIPSDFPSNKLLDIPDWLTDFLNEMPIHFIQTQRLFAIPFEAIYKYRHKKSNVISTVERYSEEMVDRIQTSLKQSAVRATSLDRTFPHRLLDSELPSNVTQEQIRNQYSEQAEYRSRLMNAGLIDPEDPVALPPSNLDKNALRVLWHYQNDVQEKFDVFDSLLKRIELFKEIINTRFLYKNFSVDKENGFIFKTDKKRNVPLRTLSSGEQHELVLAFELLFRVDEGTLILIDEPELSLHVTWQHKFLEDIARISDLVNLDFLVATHSPSIIHKQSHLMVPLGETR